jgi:hypothetical protein
VAISSKIIADSISNKGKRITTFEIEMPRWILSEFNTHRMLSRNSASSRAIPIKANIDNIYNNTAIPVHWGLNQAGMVADAEASDEIQRLAIACWIRARDNAITSALTLDSYGIHKQVANRLIELFTYQRVIVTGTEFANYFWLRNHKDAQPEIKELADLMYQDYTSSKPVILDPDMWHTPYYRLGFWAKGMPEPLQDALKISASCCAQVSYRKQDDSLEKANRVYDMLNLEDESDETRKHASPVEHQASPISWCVKALSFTWEKGVTHRTRQGDLWSGNFNGWVQHRQLIKDESKKG